MQGYFVPRKAGWDVTGFPLNSLSKRNSDSTASGTSRRMGIAEFNEKCRESVLGHVGKFAELTERMGYWVDMDAAYWTMSPDYVQSVWWSLKQIYDAGLLGEDHRVSPYCPRCGTALSDHELAQGYEEITDPSVYVKFPLTSGELPQLYPGISLLVWTTTPWTLVSIPLSPLSQTRRTTSWEFEGSFFIVAADLVEQTFGEGSEVRASYPELTLSAWHIRGPLTWWIFGRPLRRHG